MSSRMGFADDPPSLRYAATAEQKATFQRLMREPEYDRIGFILQGVWWHPVRSGPGDFDALLDPSDRHGRPLHMRDEEWRDTRRRFRGYVRSLVAKGYNVDDLLLSFRRNWTRVRDRLMPI